jgi:predicted DNA-binding transcriptional regulator AlpA
MHDTPPKPQLISAQELAELLGCALQTLYNWRDLRKGPKGFRLGGTGQLRYFMADVIEWIESDRDREGEVRQQ